MVELMWRRTRWGPGADAQVTNDFGDTAVSLARLKGFTRTAEAIERAMVPNGVSA